MPKKKTAYKNIRPVFRFPQITAKLQLKHRKGGETYHKFYYICNVIKVFKT